MRLPRRLAGVAALGLSAGLALAACGGGDGGGEGGEGATPSWEDCAENMDTCNEGEVAAEGGEVIWAMEQEQSSWNTNTSSGNTLVLAQIMQNIQPGVGTFTPSGTWEWNLDLLAEEPTLTSEDPQTWVYKISPDAKWSDGTDITADDFIFHWKQLSGDPAHCDGCTPPSTSGYDAMESVVGSDGGKTVTVTLKEGQKFAEWQFLFTGMYPAHIGAEQGDLDTPEGVKAASDYFAATQPDWSAGPWQIVEADLAEQVIFEPNENWYGEGPHLSQLTYRIITEQDALLQAMQNAEITGSSPQPNPDMVETIDQLPGVLNYVGPSYAWEHIDLNLTNEWLADTALRQAMFTAVDVNDINQRTYASFYPEVTPKKNHLFVESSEYFEDVVTPTGFGSGDVDAAMDILTGAGYELVDGTLMKDGEQVGPLRFVHTEGNELRATIAQLFQSYMSELGIEVTIETTNDLGGTLASGDFDVMVFAWVGSPAFQGSGNQFWHSESPSNFGKYSNPEVDKLVTDALNQSDLGAVAELLNQAAAIVMEEAYSLPIADRPAFTFIQDDFVNVRPNFTQVGNGYNIQEWGLASAAE